jgi:hypothetical protein
MLASTIVHIAIRRPFAEVYDFLADPAKFPLWAANPGSSIEPLGGGDWLVDLPRGRLAIRFSRRNAFGVLDYQVFPPGEPAGPVTPARLVANEEGCELILLWFQRPGTSDESFASEAAWIGSDFERLKALLEGRE